MQHTLNNPEYRKRCKKHDQLQAQIAKVKQRYQKHRITRAEATKQLKTIFSERIELMLDQYDQDIKAAAASKAWVKANDELVNLQKTWAKADTKKKQKLKARK